MNADAFRFLRAYMESPGKIAAVAPSSPYPVSYTHLTLPTIYSV